MVIKLKQLGQGFAAEDSDSDEEEEKEEKKQERHAPIKEIPSFRVTACVRLLAAMFFALSAWMMVQLAVAASNVDLDYRLAEHNPTGSSDKAGHNAVLLSGFCQQDLGCFSTTAFASWQTLLPAKAALAGFGRVWIVYAISGALSGFTALVISVLSLSAIFGCEIPGKCGRHAAQLHLTRSSRRLLRGSYCLQLAPCHLWLDSEPGSGNRRLYLD